MFVRNLFGACALNPKLNIDSRFFERNRIIKPNRLTSTRIVRHLVCSVICQAKISIESLQNRKVVLVQSKTEQIMKKEFLLCGATGFLALTMFGCSTNTANTNNGNAAVVTNAANSTTTTTSAVSEDDREFFTKAAQGGIFEVKAAQFVAGKAQNQEVKAFAQRMIADHTKANDELKALAAKKGVTLPTDVNDDQRKDYDELAKLSGAELDKEYVSMMVSDHNDDVDEFSEQATEANDADLRAFAAKTLPVLQSHQAQIKEIKSKMK